MRLLPLVFLVLAACDPAPSIEEAVLDYQTAQGILDAEDCGSVELSACADDDDVAAVAIQCFADALEACSPAILETVDTNGDGGETHVVLVIHLDGTEECAVQRFIQTPNLWKNDVSEAACEGVAISEEVCEAPEAHGCEEPCGQDMDCG